MPSETISPEDLCAFNAQLSLTVTRDQTLRLLEDKLRIRIFHSGVAKTCRYGRDRKTIHSCRTLRSSGWHSIVFMGGDWLQVLARKSVVVTQVPQSLHTKVGVNLLCYSFSGASGSVNDYGALLQAGKLRVRIQIRFLDFLNLSRPFSSTMTLGWTQYLTGMSTRNHLGELNAILASHNLTAIFEPIVWTVYDFLMFLNPIGLLDLLRGWVY